MDNSSLYPIKCFQFGPWKKRNVSMEWSHTGYSFYRFRNLLDYHQKIIVFQMKSYIKTQQKHSKFT